MNIELLRSKFPGICFHHIDPKYVDDEYQKRIENLRTGGAGSREIRAARRMKQDYIQLAQYHNDFHERDVFLTPIEKKMKLIEDFYTRKGLRGAEARDKQYRKYQSQTDSIGNSHRYSRWGPRSLPISWELCQLYDVLSFGGTDDQHEVNY